jgi:hypothetical protein
MSVGNYYALSSLPTLDPPGAPPPLSLVDLPERVPPGRSRRLVSAVLLADDLQQREAWLAGELRTPEPAVLTLAQLRGDQPLPGGVSAERAEDDAGLLPADALWGAYARHVAALARALRCSLLGEWIATEIALRNALAERRARALRLDPPRYLVAQEIEEGGLEEEAAVRAWVEAPDPLAALRALLLARWRWIGRRDRRFTFRDEEFLAYAVRLVILHRWRRAGAGTRGAWR